MTQHKLPETTRFRRYSPLCSSLCALLAVVGCADPETSSDGAEFVDAAQQPGRQDAGAEAIETTDSGQRPTPPAVSQEPGRADGGSPSASTHSDPSPESTDHQSPANSGPSVADGGGSGTAPESDGGVLLQPDPTLNEGEFSVAAFNYVDPKPVGFNPLGKERFNLLLLEETAVVISSEAGGWLVDDGQHEHTHSSLSAALSPAAMTAFWTASGNFDADGHAELVVLNYGAGNIHVVVGDNDGNTALGVQHSWDISSGGAAAGSISAAIGDFDGDGRDELAIAAAGASGWLRIYDDADAGFALLKDAALGQGQSALEIAAGNFDADSAAELAVLRIGTSTDDVAVSILDDVGHDLAVLHSIPAENLLPDPGAGTEDSAWMSGGFLRVGNIDADATDELYLYLSQLDVGGEGEGGLRVSGRVFDDVATTAAIVATPHAGKLRYTTGSLERPVDATFADMDGDGVDELYLLHLDPEEPNLAWNLSQWNPSANTYDWSEIADGTTLALDYNETSHGRLAAVDGDGLSGQSIVIALQNSGASLPVETFRVAAVPVVTADDQHQSFALEIPEPEISVDNYPSGSVPLVAGGDFDNDSLQVKYTGENWQTLSSPRPIVVMAAPPIKDGISQNSGASGTAFGQETTQGGAATHEVSTTYSTTLSFESSALTGLFGSLGAVAGGSVSKTMSDAFSSSQTTTTIETVGTRFGGAYPDDCIVFQGVLYTSYAYEVTRASDPAVLGKRMTVDVPVAVKTYKWTLDFYNQMLSPGDVAIGAETLNHVVGDPTSYPSASVRDQILASAVGWKSKQVSVGQGNGQNSVTLDLSKENTHGSSSTISNENTWGVAIAGAGYNSSVAMSETGFYDVIVGSATSYEGIVGDISAPADYQKYAYDFGLFVYEFAHPAGPRFQVINYWTSNFGPAL